MKRGFYYTFFGGLAVLFCVGAVVLAVLLRAPARADGEVVLFEVASGAGFREISGDLAEKDLIRSRNAFEAYAILSGSARRFRPGVYAISPDMSGWAITKSLRTGEGREVEVTIPEGSTIFDIDEILARSKVTERGAFTKFALGADLEGHLFPDTYHFYLKSDPAIVAARFEDVFQAKLKPLLGEDPQKARDILIAASILEKEVPLPEDRRKVMDLLLRREEEGIPLQVDASVCYAKRLRVTDEPCYPVTVLDTKMASTYNTYLHKGWPPGPISNPGQAAVEAALSPIPNPFWYYLSDPATKKTIFSITLEEHAKNRTKYLLSR